MTHLKILVQIMENFFLDVLHRAAFERFSLRLKRISTMLQQRRWGRWSRWSLWNRWANALNVESITSEHPTVMPRCHRGYFTAECVKLYDWRLFFRHFKHTVWSNEAQWNCTLTVLFLCNEKDKTKIKINCGAIFVWMDYRASRSLGFFKQILYKILSFVFLYKYIANTSTINFISKHKKFFIFQTMILWSELR